MVSDHRKDIAMFRLQSRVGDRLTASLARRQLPTLQRHLSIAQSIRA
jgi:putative membrane protein